MMQMETGCDLPDLVSFDAENAIRAAKSLTFVLLSFRLRNTLYRLVFSAVCHIRAWTISSDIAIFVPSISAFLLIFVSKIRSWSISWSKYITETLGDDVFLVCDILFIAKVN